MSDNSYLDSLSKKERWTRDIIDIVIERLEVSNGDAQGYVEARSFELSQEWGKGSSAEVAAERLISIDTV